MMLAICRLERMEEVVGREVEIKLVENHFLKKFGQERKIGDWAIVFEVVWIQVVFFEERVNDGRLENVWD
jgi:hypothetical protein